MKRIVIGLLLVLLPIALFAQVQVGGTALYNYPLSPGSTPELTASNFTVGADARLKILFFQASALGLFTPGTDVTPASIDLFADGGLTFDFLLFRFGLGAGPNFRLPLGEGEASGFGLNVKATADVMLGKLAVGLSYLNSFELAPADAGELFSQDYSQGLLGVSLLFTL